MSSAETFRVDYSGAQPVVHRAGCNHTIPSEPLDAATLDIALTEARYGGFEPGDASDLGDTYPASCTR